MPAEYTPLAIRQKAAALASASNWIFTFVVVWVKPFSRSPSSGTLSYINMDETC